MCPRKHAAFRITALTCMRACAALVLVFVRVLSLFKQLFKKSVEWNLTGEGKKRENHKEEDEVMKKQTAAEHDVMVAGARQLQFQNFVSLKSKKSKSKNNKIMRKSFYLCFSIYN